ncbi:MAG: sigma-70 family RNA polymerase sigma factor [Gilvibacter sp.]
MQNHLDFTAVIKANEGIIYKIVSMYCDTREDKKDLYQEIVYQLYKSFDSFRGDSKVSTWMYRIALNTSITHINKKKRSGTQIPFEIERFTETTEADQSALENLKLLHDLIAQLSAIDKGIVLLFLEDKSYAQIAQITGFSESNIGTRMARIKTKLKNKHLNNL